MLFRSNERLRKAWAKMTVEDVNAAIEKYLHPEELVIAMVVKDAAATKEALVSGVASPIAYDTKPPPFVPAEDEEISKLPLRIAADRVTIVPVATIFE